MAVEDYTKTYEDVLNVIEQRLGREAWYDAYTGDLDTFFKIANQAGITVNRTKSNKIISFVDKQAQSLGTSESTQIAENLNSNLQSGTAAVDNTVSFGNVIDTTATETAGTIKASSKLTKFTDGVKGTLNTPVAGKITAPILAASTGVLMGKAIDGAIYNIGEAMGANPPESLNPETWNDITQDMSDKGLTGIDKFAFNTILGLDPKSGETTMYADENAVAYMALYMAQRGIFKEGEEVSQGGNEGGGYVPSGISKVSGVTSKQKLGSFEFNLDGSIGKKATGSYIGADARLESGNAGTIMHAGWVKKDDDISLVISLVYQDTVGYVFKSGDNYAGGTTGNSTYEYTYKDATVYYRSISQPENSPIVTPQYVPANVPDDKSLDIQAIAWSLWFGNYISTAPVKGVSALPNLTGTYTIPNIDPNSTPKDVLDQLKKSFPNLWNNRVENNVVQPDGSVKKYTYIPVPIPSGGLGNAPTTTGNTWNPTLNLPKITVAPTNKITPETDPDNKLQPASDTQLATIIKFITDPISKPQNMTDTIPSNPAKPDTPILNPTPNPNPPATGGGDTPSVTPPTGTASALYAIYNPTLAQINDFGAWLWSENFVDQIKKLFSDPMQAIIGLHKVYATPITGGSQNIKVGYLDSGVSSKVVTEQYTTINCGSVALSEYFGNVFDYSPYTTVNLYLPFIGIVSLDVADVMRSTLTITYHVDVLTGACLAEVRVKRDNAGGVLYQYSGNAAVTLPISSGSYMGIVTSLASAATGIVGTIASGGALAPMLIGAAGTALNARTNVEHSGSFSGNAGAMGGKIPYLIISRPQTELADNYENYIGNPSNTTTTLGSCSGYVQVKECHLEGIPATQSELERIESLLKGGVLI